MPIPFLGRLHPTEYLSIIVSFFLVGLEAFIRVFTLALPSFLVSLFYRVSRRLFNSFSSPAQKKAENRKKSVYTSVRHASDFVELCRLWGYEAEEHIVQTKDGFLLGLHRLQWKKGEEDQLVNCGPKSTKKRVAYLHHGLLMNSEVWVCLTDEQRCLPFELVERGFDVWFGNNRGNKYSKKSIHHSPTSVEFWDFSIDEFAFYDIPDTIEYILDTTGQSSLSYIGFSQGSAQAFATLAIHPKLNRKVDVFIGLAPAMAPAGLSNGVVDALVRASPSVLYLMFGRRAILNSAAMWESLLYPPLFCNLIDRGLLFLFGWTSVNISTSQKLAAYPHLYSYTSTKSVVHWFQIIRNRCLQMYDDDVYLQPTGPATASKYSKVARYPTRNIKTPVVLVYGGSDSLVDIRAMLRELPPQTVATEIPHYEHLDFLWARDVQSQVFQHVFDALDSFTDADHSKEEYDRYRIARNESLVETALGVARSTKAHTPSKLPSHAHRDSESDTSVVLLPAADAATPHYTSTSTGTGIGLSTNTSSTAHRRAMHTAPTAHRAREPSWGPSSIIRTKTALEIISAQDNTETDVEEDMDMDMDMATDANDADLDADADTTRERRGRGQREGKGEAQWEEEHDLPAAEIKLRGHGIRRDRPAGKAPPPIW